MLKRILLLSSILSAGVGLAACGSGGGAVYGGSVSAGVAYGADPELVEIQPDVWVVEGYDEPVFYSDNSYWRFSGGIWYRSSYYDRGWVTVYDVPYRLRSIDRPTAYVRYHAPYGSRVRQGPRGTIIVRNENNDRRDRYNNDRLDRRYPAQQYVDQQRAQRQREDQRLRQQRQEEQIRQDAIRLENERAQTEHLRQQQQAQEARRQEQMQRQQQLDQQRAQRQEQRDQRQQEQQQRFEENRAQREQQAQQREQRQQDRRDQQKDKKNKKQKKNQQ
jgi:hypothetical protein